MPVRWALRLEYDGSGFVGWQRQASGLSVQEALETAAERLTGGEKVSSAVAGRTDAGVHAEGQIACLDLPIAIAAERLADALNFHLKPNRVAVLAVRAAAADWHPRFSAIGRAYRYTILDRRAPPALLAGRVWHVPHRLDDEAMHRAAQSLLGRHDFSSFRASACQAASPWRTLDRLEVRRAGELIHVLAEARSFLHHQVRNMVGTLKLVGEGRWEEAHAARVLAACDRRAAGPTAPAQGLCLTEVRYAEDPFSPRPGS